MLVQFTGYVGRVADDVVGQNIFSNNLFFVVKRFLLFSLCGHSTCSSISLWLKHIARQFVTSCTGLSAGLVDLIIRKRYNFSYQFRKESMATVNPLCHVGGSLKEYGLHM